jgi:acyl phosphate:glycerol-3-phosphate acyltransferase
VIWWPWLIPPAAYVLGSLSPAYWAGRLHGLDLREHGSKSLGATNAGRVLGGRWFVIVFLLDLGKGLAAVAAARWLPGLDALSGDQRMALALSTAVAVVLGHIFTCFHRFNGGKAVATSLGVLIALAPWVAIGAFIVWLIAWTIGRCCGAKPSDAVGPASVFAAISAPVIHCLDCAAPWRLPELPLTLFISILALVVVIRHHKNIRKLFARAPD